MALCIIFPSRDGWTAAILKDGVMLHGICILIPSYQPSDKLRELVREIRQLNASISVLIVDDGSGDGFAEYFNQAASVAGVTVIRDPINQGKGAAIKHGISHLLTHHEDVAGIVTADGDGQHSPKDILKIAETLEAKPDSFVLGCRTFGAGVPLRSLVGNMLSRFIYRLALRFDFKDTQTGLRGLPLWMAKETLSITANRYELETEQLRIAAKHKDRITLIPIATIYEDNNAASHFSPVFDSMRIYFSLFRYSLSSAVTAGVDMVFFVSVFHIDPSIFAATMAGRAASVLVQFTLLKRFVFKTEAGIREFIEFVGYVVLTGFISVGLQEQITIYVQHYAVLVKLVAESAIFIINYVFLRGTIFSRKREA